MVDEPLVSTGRSGDLNAGEHDTGQAVGADLLAEEVSIDGMCGVY
jgi:mycofactocin precursor